MMDCGGITSALSAADQKGHESREVQAFNNDAEFHSDAVDSADFRDNNFNKMGSFSPCSPSNPVVSFDEGDHYTSWSSDCNLKDKSPNSEEAEMGSAGCDPCLAQFETKPLEIPAEEDSSYQNLNYDESNTCPGNLDMSGVTKEDDRNFVVKSVSECNSSQEENSFDLQQKSPMESCKKGKDKDSKCIEEKMDENLKQSDDDVDEDIKHSDQNMEESGEKLMKFAEILYKCTLCTSLPSVLTSKDNFYSHVQKQHLRKNGCYKGCQFCNLTFGTEEDLRAHMSLTHFDTNSSVSDNRKDSGNNDVLPGKLHLGVTDWMKTESETHKSLLRNNTYSNEQRDCDLYEDQPSPTHNDDKQTTCNNNISRLQQLTDQILSSNTATRALLTATSNQSPAYTPEFGHYTKLVREGGNIVYFCQVCNWKSQLKAAFHLHCSGQGHLRKVRTADQNEPAERQQLSSLQSSERAREFEYHEPVSWSPRRSAPNRQSPGFYVGKTPNKFGLSLDDQNIKMHNSQADSMKNNRISSLNTGNVCQNKRKRPSPISVRNQLRMGDDWSDSDLEEENGIRKVHCQRILGPSQRTILPRFEGKHLTYGDNKDKKTSTQSYCNSSLRFSSLGLDKNLSPNVTVGKMASTDEQAPEIGHRFSPSISERQSMDDSGSGHHRDDYHTIVQIKTEPDAGDSAGERLESDDQDSGDGGMYRCSLCVFSCTQIQEYKQHFIMEHDTDLTETLLGDGGKSLHGESWKMVKIRAILPDLLCECTKGNVSRDLLLQKVSSLLNIPESKLWGPACNKAVREEFPNSLAQRKGKYKKTYFFGVALIEQLKEQEELSDSENVTYQPLRDMSQDLEKILEHLPTIVYWTGEMGAGVSRDELLQLLGDRIEEPDVPHWGVQCNRSMRMLFPNIEMKRKGKFKTTVFFGVDFMKNLQKQSFVPNKRGRPRKHSPSSELFASAKQTSTHTDHHHRRWLEAIGLCRDRNLNLPAIPYFPSSHFDSSFFRLSSNSNSKQTVFPAFSIEPTCALSEKSMSDFRLTDRDTRSDLGSCLDLRMSVGKAEEYEKETSHTKCKLYKIWSKDEEENDGDDEDDDYEEHKGPQEITESSSLDRTHGNKQKTLKHQKSSDHQGNGSLDLGILKCENERPSFVSKKLHRKRKSFLHLGPTNSILNYVDSAHEERDPALCHLGSQHLKRDVNSSCDTSNSDNEINYPTTNECEVESKQ